MTVVTVLPESPCDIRGSRHRAGSGAGPGRSHPERADADVRRVVPAAPPGTADGSCTDRCTRPGPPGPTSAQWSRPIRFRACSVLARMRRYKPVAAVIIWHGSLHVRDISSLVLP